MIKYVQISRWDILKCRMLACATLTTVKYVETSVFDRYIHHSEKAWVALFKWVLNKHFKSREIS